LVNGTSVMTGIAVNCVSDTRLLIALTLSAHALMFQGLRGNVSVLNPFIHQHKPHPGQVWVAQRTSELLKQSRWVHGDGNVDTKPVCDGLAQDRYSLRCLPQFIGPIVDGLTVVGRQIETEANSATDNPLFDGLGEVHYEGGNFLGQYVGVAMDQLRLHLGLAAKHLDAQIALLVSPEFSNGLPPSLAVGSEPVSMGLKALQLTGNSIVPELLHLGAPLVDRFQTHAEQFNQNVNSLGFGAANLARRSVFLFRQYIAVALLFGVQSIDLRAHCEEGHFDGRVGLSPALIPLYEAIYGVCSRKPTASEAFVHDDRAQSLESHIAALAGDIAAGGSVAGAVRDTVVELGHLGRLEPGTMGS